MNSFRLAWRVNQRLKQVPVGAHVIEKDPCLTQSQIESNKLQD